MYYDDYFDEEEAIIECALDIYDEYEVSIEEAIDIAMEKVVYTPGGYEAKKIKEKDPNVDWKTNDEYANALVKNNTFLNALRDAGDGEIDNPYKRKWYNGMRDQYGDYGWKKGKKSNRKIKFKDKVIDRDNPKPNPKPEPTPSAPTPTPIKNPTPKPNPKPEPTPSAPIKRRINPKTGIAVGAGAAALGAGVALYKYRKKKLAEKAMKRAKAKDAVAQAKEASIYFDYD